MTRRRLAAIWGERAAFFGRFERYGTKAGWSGQETTVLLKDIRDAEGRLLCDHLWFNYTKGFRSLGELRPGEHISFEARVTRYIKGYVNHREMVDERRVDFRLSYPTHVQRADMPDGSDPRGNRQNGSMRGQNKERDLTKSKGNDW